MFSTWRVVASSAGDAMTMSRSSLRCGAPSRCLLGLGGRFDPEDVVVLVLEVASLVRPQAARASPPATTPDDRGDVDEVTV